MKKDSKKDILLFVCLFAVYLAGTFFLFHRQTVLYGGKYISDMIPYLTEVRGQDSGYDYPYPVMFLCARVLAHFLTPEWGLTLAVTLLNALSAPVLKCFLERKEKISGIGATVSTFALLCVSMLYPLTYLGRYREVEEGFLYRYLGVFTPNPYHNATYLAARPFTIVAFFAFVEILSFYEENKKWYCREYGIFSVALFMATMTKPSFTLVFVATAGWIMLWRWLRSGGKGWRAFLQLGIYFIPTFAALLYQYSGVFTGGNGEREKGIGFGIFTAWATVCDNIPRAVLLGTAFPLAVLVFQNRRVLQNKLLLFGWQFFGIGFATFALLFEKGYRMVHLNFAWGYMYGLFFLQVVSLGALLKDTAKRRQKVWILGIQWAAFGLHLICGIDYLRVLLMGGLFH